MNVYESLKGKNVIVMTRTRKVAGKLEDYDDIFGFLKITISGTKDVVIIPVSAVEYIELVQGG
jgi:hypothetical protein